MSIQRTDFKAIGYCITFTTIIYILSSIYIIIPNPSLGTRLAILILTFVMLYIITRIFYGNPFKIEHQSPYFDSFIYVLSLIAILTILSLPVVILLEGVNININEIYIKAKPGFVDSWEIYLPLYALIYWGVNGIIVAYFYHTVTIELFKKRSRLIGVIAATTLVAINYNAPLLSNYWNWWDIIGYGLIFAYSYSAKRNPPALLYAYLLFEVPLWWCILAPFGENIFALYFIGRVVISIIALVIFAYKESGMKREHIEGEE